MSNNISLPVQSSYDLYVSKAHDCAYLNGHEARSLFLDPATRINQTIYQLLIDQGFRRSGPYLYQPACSACNACLSMRIPVASFTPNRSQRRNWQQNVGRLQVSAHPAEFSSEHFELYCRYQEQRHTNGAMDIKEPEQYMNFLSSSWADTVFYEFRDGKKLAGVAVTDRLTNGLSSVYTFFDLERRADGLGVFALLWQIEHTKNLGKQWVYPGFWIKDSDKMSYKSAYRPLELWDGMHWKRYERNARL